MDRRLYTIRAMQTAMTCLEAATDPQEIVWFGKEVVRVNEIRKELGIGMTEIFVGRGTTPREHIAPH